MSSRNTLSRRTLLAGLGLGAGSLFLPSLLGREGLHLPASAQDPVAKRFILFWTAHGTVRPSWKISHPSLVAGRDTEIDLTALTEAEMSPILRPLHRHRAKLNVLEGLAQTSTLADVATNNHEAARAHLLTGAQYRVEDFARAAAPSIDQFIADGISRPDRFRSLEYGTASIVSGPGGAIIPSQRRSDQAFNQLFPAGSGTGMSEPTLEDRVRARRGSVLDLATDEYDRLSGQLSGEDRQKLELHRDMIADLEARVRSTGSISCEAPVLDDDALFDQFARLTAAAVACDLSRVVSLQWGQLATAEFGAPSVLDVHENYAHQAWETARDGESASGREVREDAMHWMSEYNLHHSNQFAFLLDLLDSIPEGDGTVLDNSCVLWLTELATGTHELNDMPVVMAGGLAGEFRTGRYLRYGQTRPIPASPWNGAEPIGPAHSKLLVSIAQGFGLPMDALPFSRATAEVGGDIDWSGPLEGLT